MKRSKNIQLVLDILKDEVEGDAKGALKKMTGDYSMTWMYKWKDELFPSSEVSEEKDLMDVYPIKGREYDIRNIAEGEDLVMLELIESYPDPKTGKMYRTPQVIVLEIKDGKIKKGRHYCDPQVSHIELSLSQAEEALKGTESKLKIT